MRLRTDDTIHNAPIYWIDVGGKEMPFIARYITWVAGALVFLPALTVARLIGFGFLFSLVVAGAASAWFGTFVANHVNGEHPFTSWWATLAALHADRRRRRRSPQDAKTVTFRPPF